jgi:hypothetical protein
MDIQRDGSLGNCGYRIKSPAGWNRRATGKAGREGRYMKHTSGSALPSRRISIARLEAIYGIQHGVIGDETRKVLMHLTPEDFRAVPDSSGQTFGEWFDRIKQIIDVYEDPDDRR